MCEKIRCWDGPFLFVDYHDNEWGRPVHDDGKLFEMLILECMQAGLSWITVLKKREAFREAFDGFDPVKIALFNDEKIEALMKNEGIIRNRLKIDAAVNNARMFLKVTEEYGSFDKFIWGYVGNIPVIGRGEWLANTPLSDKISKDLKKMGFKFVGSTTIYAFLQAAGIVNDHIPECFVYEEILNDNNQ